MTRVWVKLTMKANQAREREDGRIRILPIGFTLEPAHVPFSFLLKESVQKNVFSLILSSQESIELASWQNVLALEFQGS